MFKKLSLSLHKSPKIESNNYNNVQHAHLNRDSLIESQTSQYIDMTTNRESLIEPNMLKSNQFVQPTTTKSSSYTDSYYYNNDEEEYDSKPPPLTIDHYSDIRNSLMVPSPASIPSPVTPNGVNMSSTEEIEIMVQQGITFHEKGQLEKATSLFRIAAEKENPLGMFLYGVSLRHGWGCKTNEHLAFQYLQKAAEHAVEDLANITNTVNTSASKGELIMAIYELGVSFRHGWGCKKNKESAVQFFKIAADLGDPDAQNDLGHCYYQGQGVKKDLGLAAKYYRKADKQGQGIMGNSWIWKTKYDPK